MKKLIIIYVLISLVSCSKNPIEEQVPEQQILEHIETTEIEEDSTYTLNNETSFTISVPKSPPSSRVILELLYKNGEKEIHETNPNDYLSIRYVFNKDLKKAKLKVVDLDGSSGVKFSVKIELIDISNDYEYFSIVESNIRYFSKEIDFN